MVQLIVVASLGFAAWVGLWYGIYLALLQVNSVKRAEKLAQRQRLLRSGVKRV